MRRVGETASAAHRLSALPRVLSVVPKHGIVTGVIRLASSARFDVEKLDVERRRIGVKPATQAFTAVEFSLGDGLTLSAPPPKYPFVPDERNETARRAELILTMQAHALRSRFDAIKCNARARIGVNVRAVLSARHAAHEPTAVFGFAAATACKPSRRWARPWAS